MVVLEPGPNPRVAVHRFDGESVQEIPLPDITDGTYEDLTIDPRATFGGVLVMHESVKDADGSYRYPSTVQWVDLGDSPQAGPAVQLDFAVGSIAANPDGTISYASFRPLIEPGKAFMVMSRPNSDGSYPPATAVGTTTPSRSWSWIPRLVALRNGTMLFHEDQTRLLGSNLRWIPRDGSAPIDLLKGVRVLSMVAIAEPSDAEASPDAFWPPEFSPGERPPEKASSPRPEAASPGWVPVAFAAAGITGVVLAGVVMLRRRWQPPPGTEDRTDPPDG